MIGFARLAAASVTLVGTFVARSSAAASPALPTFSSMDTLCVSFRPLGRAQDDE